MRTTILTLAALLAAALVIPPTGFAKSRSFNECVDLAKQRGFSSADRMNPDASMGNTSARRFVPRCMQGAQR